MPHPIQFGAIHIILGPNGAVQTKRDQLTEQATTKSEPWVACTEFHNLSNTNATAAAVVLTANDVTPGMKTQDVRDYIKNHPNKDADGKPVQRHNLFSHWANPFRRLWYTFGSWISLDQRKKGLTHHRTRSKP